MTKTVEITITAQVTTSVQLSAGESLDDLKERYVDIYLHGPGEDGCYDKRDVGANKWTITTNPEGGTVEVSAGCLTHEQRKHYFNDPQAFLDQIHKGKFFPVGMKDKLRFPTWETFRASSDMPES